LEQIKIFENYWEIIESNAKDYSKEESRVSDFIRDYLTYKIKKIPNKTAVYEEFKLRYPERNNKFYNETIKELKEFSIFYHKLINPTKEEDSEISKELNFINRLEINVSYPFLLPVYNDYANNIIDKTTLVNILRLIQSYTWRRFIQDLPTSTINKIFLNLYSDINTNNYYESLEKALVKKKNRQRFPTNGEIEVTLALKDVYNTKSKNTVYLLELLENFNNREYVSIENPDITIEHIYPQNPDAKWYDMLEENSIKEIEDKYLHTISNLTLSGNNGSLGNKTFADKKFLNKDNRQQGYIYSRLWLNQYLKEIDEWNLDTLQKRYKILYDRFIQIWKYPDVILEDEEVENDEDYNIFNAPDPRHRKLDYFIFKDEKIITDEVAKMYYHVVSNLFDENSSAFNHPDLKNLLFLSTNPSDLRSPYKLNSSYYIEANIDNNTKFKKLKTLLTKFDCEEELLINFSNNDMTELDSAVKDRSYWDEKSSKESLFILDECLELMHEFEPLINYNYTQSYIGISIENKIQNFVIFVPKKSFIRLAIYIEDSALWINRLEEVGFKVISVGKKSGKIRFRITRENIQKNMAFLRDLFLNSYKNWQK
ncbi:MAG: HNH endonuclease family protein, partial [Saprospiraceae bacterium]